MDAGRLTRLEAVFEVEREECLDNPLVCVDVDSVKLGIEGIKNEKNPRWNNG